MGRAGLFFALLETAPHQGRPPGQGLHRGKGPTNPYNTNCGGAEPRVFISGPALGSVILLIKVWVFVAGILPTSPHTLRFHVCIILILL